ncbi:MAG: hypothetical protein R3A79_26170 [Nannocystaceae bacterium]
MDTKSTPTIIPSAVDLRFSARTFAVNDNRELHGFSVILRREGDALEGVAFGMFREPVELRGSVARDPFGEHLLLAHGERGQPNQARISLVRGLLGGDAGESLVGSFTYTTDGDGPTPRWPVHNCCLVPEVIRAPKGEAPALREPIDAVAGATRDLVIEPGKEYFIVDPRRYLAVEWQGRGVYNWAYGGSGPEHDYCRVRFTADPVETFAQMTITNPEGELRALRANADVSSWAYLFWGDGSQGAGEPVLNVKAERVGADTFRLYHQRLATKMWLGYGGTGGGWAVIEGTRDEPQVFTVVEAPPVA